MKENLNIAIIGIGLGLFGAAVWYAEMFTDSKAANLWRRMNGKGQISGSSELSVGDRVLVGGCG